MCVRSVRRVYCLTDRLIVRKVRRWIDRQIDSAGIQYSILVSVCVRAYVRVCGFVGVCSKQNLSEITGEMSCAEGLSHGKLMADYGRSLERR